MLGLLVACAGAQPADSADPCASYLSVGVGPHALCTRRIARALATPAEARARCARLVPEDDQACRTDWVMAHMTGPTPTRALLEACGDADDCGFYVVDHRPEPDVFLQAARCAAHAGRYQRDCLGHAWERWARAHPDPDALRNAAARSADGGRSAGLALGAVLAGAGHPCPADAPPALAQACGETRSPQGPPPTPAPGAP